MLVQVENGKVVGIKGDPDNPVNLGWICGKANAVPEYVHHPARLIHPMRKVRGSAGPNAWERISWDEALDTIAHRIHEVQSEYGPLSVGMAQGTGRLFFMWPLRLLHSIGGVNWYEPGLEQCLFPRIASANLTYRGN